LRDLFDENTVSNGNYFFPTTSISLVPLTRVLNMYKNNATFPHSSVESSSLTSCYSSTCPSFEQDQA
jgi:hypothetical protein